MTLAHPWLLLLALPVAVAAWARLTRRAGGFLGMPLDAARAPESTRGRAARLVPVLLNAGALLLVVLALARPQRVRPILAGEGLGVDIVLVVDTSTSMNALDFKPNRLGAAKATARDFVRGRAQDRIGLVTFGGAPLLACPPTLDYDALTGRIDDLETGMTGADGTAVGDGLVAALRRLDASKARSKVAILLTDGRSNTGVVDPVTAAKTAEALGVKVYTIGVAGRGPAQVPLDDGQIATIDDDLDEETLAEMASLTGGKFWRASGSAGLREVFAEIDRLEKSKVKLPDLTLRDDRHAWPLALALLLLLAESALSATVLLRWP